MERDEIKKVIEALLFITDEPVSLKKFYEIFENSISKESIREIIEEIKKEYNEKNSALQIKEVAEGYQFATRQEYSKWVKKLFKDRITMRLSVSALETLAIIAYKQPITRAEIEEIRGVETISVLETLLERKLVKIIGRKETVGRPLLYGTTSDFLRYFGLSSLSDMPSLEEMNQDQNNSGSETDEGIENSTQE